uniref:Aspartic peptidase DDI1-type domain-containing protein n=1 Tax=Utricularia reniformis TaxID=192314 RepID=A0A1Y0B1A4_9LAMI|nr:hypothetical protein AEK19_MT0946 [Utricularia reniformis]ART31171.1 hypothetical protein AEK19_MT0946 [Utricularia reniformis]
MPSCLKLLGMMRSLEPRMNMLQLLSAMQEKPIAHSSLMYIKAMVNDVQVMAMIDTGATHHFVADREVQRLGLEVQSHNSRMK